MLFFLAMRKLEITNAGIKAIKWNIDHFKDTLLKRKKVQEIRKISDIVIINKMLKRPEKVRIFLDYLKYHKEDRWKNYF